MTFDNLQNKLARAGNHYLDRDTLRFFRSREVATWGDGNRGLYWETMGRSFSRSAGRVHKVTAFEFDGDKLTSTVIYNGLGDDSGMATQRKRAHAAVRVWLDSYIAQPA